MIGGAGGRQSEGGPAFIRLFAEADREAVIDLLWELNRVENAIAGDRAVLRADAIACLDHDIANCGDGGALMVAEIAGEIVGFLALAIEAGVPFIRADLRRHGNVLDLVVDPGHRRKGVGARLLAHAEERTRAAGCAALLIGVLNGNAGAEALYHSQGFRRYAIEMLKLIDAAKAPVTHSTAGIEQD